MMVGFRKKYCFKRRTLGLHFYEVKNAVRRIIREKILVGHDVQKDLNVGCFEYKKFD